MSRMISALSVALLATASIAQAQDVGTTRSVNFGLAAGATFPTGDFGDFYDTGFNVMGTLGFQPAAMPVGLRFDAAYNSFGANDDGILDADDAKIISGTANAVLTTSNMGGVRPYLIGGLGVYNLDAGAGDSETKFGLNGGGGIEFPLSGFTTYVEARYHSVFTENDNTNYIPLVFGIKF
ncbi:MAG: outer membrane beta-barrel protein [Gemmatimonadaceae bacterium]